jgi:hypothetical protein
MLKNWRIVWSGQLRLLTFFLFTAGVQLFPFSTLEPASGYTVAHVFGFVEELLVADDPDFDNENPNASNTNFRKSKSSHETRQTLLYLLDSAVRRKMCKTVLELGGNAVLGYHQSFDIEGDSGIVTRTYGTCVRLEKRQSFSVESSPSKIHRTYLHSHRMRNEGRLDSHTDSEPDDDSSNRRRSSVAIVSDQLSRSRSTYAALTFPEAHHHSDEDEVQLLTLRDFDPSVRVRIGGLVTSRSVKYLGNLASKLSDQETRDNWWAELRQEIRNHAKILCCSHVIGYLEASTIHEDVAILSITGTACTVRGLPNLHQQNQPRLWDNYADATHRRDPSSGTQHDLIVSSERLPSSLSSGGNKLSNR